MEKTLQARMAMLERAYRTVRETPNSSAMMLHMVPLAFATGQPKHMARGIALLIGTMDDETWEHFENAVVELKCSVGGEA